MAYVPIAEESSLESIYLPGKIIKIGADREYNSLNLS